MRNHFTMQRSGFLQVSVPVGCRKIICLWNLRECEWLGITGQGVISQYGIDFLDGADCSAIDSDLPQAVDHILIQSDNTAIAPGPLEHEVAQELALIADVESRGGATVFRFSESSIRRRARSWSHW
jgi:hypothetical protein